MINIRPIRQADLGSNGYGFLAGGRYISPSTREDFTGKTFIGGVISVTEQSKPNFVVEGAPSDAPLSRKGVGIKVNMMKQVVGWRWTDGSRPETILVSVKRGSKHFYALRVEFTSGVNLTTFPDAPTEPRLRPTAYGNLKLGEEIAKITLRGREHSVYGVITIAQAALVA